MSKLSSTIVIQLPGRILRLDVDSEFGRDSQNHRTTSEAFASTPETSCAQALSICCQTGRPLHKSTRFFSHHCWAGQVELSPSIANALTKSEVPQAIAAEAELQSALPPETTLTIVSNTGSATWNVTQCDHTEKQCVESFGLAHAVSIDYFGAIPSDIPSDLSSDDLASDLVLEALAEHTDLYPTVPANEPREQAAYKRSLVAICTAALVLVGLFHTYLSASRTGLRTEANSEVREFKKIKEQVDESQAQLLVRRAAAEHASQMADSRTSEQARLVARRERVSQKAAIARILVDSIAECADDNVWIKEFEFNQPVGPNDPSEDGNATIIRGIATDTPVSVAFAEAFSDALQNALSRQQFGTQAQAVLNRTSTLDDRKTCEFELSISFPPSLALDGQGVQHD